MRLDLMSHILGVYIVDFPCATRYYFPFGPVAGGGPPRARDLCPVFLHSLSFCFTTS